MADRTSISLGATQETLLIPLYGRATLTRAGVPLIDDPKAVEMVESIDYDFGRFDGTMSLIGSVLRTRIFDHWIGRWMRENPGGTVVEVGAGLNTRYERLDDGRTRWIELDLPDAAALRREFFAETERRRIVAGSVLDADWLDSVAETGGPWFFAAEAVLIYLEPQEVAAALAAIGARYPGSLLAFDTWSTWMRDHQDEHDTIGAMDARFTWFCDDLARLDPPGSRVEVHESCTFLDAPEEVLSLLPVEMRELAAARADDPQMTGYRQNLVSLHPRTNAVRP